MLIVVIIWTLAGALFAISYALWRALEKLRQAEDELGAARGALRAAQRECERAYGDGWEAGFRAPDRFSEQQQ